MIKNPMHNFSNNDDRLFLHGAKPQHKAVEHARLELQAKFGVIENKIEIQFLS